MKIDERCMIRAEWAKRPLAIREAAFKARCSWVENANGKGSDIFNEPEPEEYALDLPDVPAPAPDARVDLTPYLTAAAILVAYGYWRKYEDGVEVSQPVAERTTDCARALRDAATGGSNE